MQKQIHFKLQLMIHFTVQLRGAPDSRFYSPPHLGTSLKMYTRVRVRFYERVHLRLHSNPLADPIINAQIYTKSFI